MNTKFKLFVFPAILLALALYFGVRLNWQLDNTIPKVEFWLKTNRMLIGEIGVVQEIVTRRSTHVSESSDHQAYKKYTFYAKGTKGKAIVRVKVVGENSFEIIVIE